jgi:hypothetical protein
MSVKKLLSLDGGAKTYLNVGLNGIRNEEQSQNYPIELQIIRNM